MKVYVTSWCFGDDHKILGVAKTQASAVEIAIKHFERKKGFEAKAAAARDFISKKMFEMALKTITFDENSNYYQLWKQTLTE
jgi:hypothetical protein